MLRFPFTFDKSHLVFVFLRKERYNFLNWFTLSNIEGKIVNEKKKI